MQRDCHVSPGADLVPGFQAGTAEEVCCRYCFMLCKKPSRGLDFLWAPWFREAVNTIWTCTKKEVKEKWLINNAEYLSISVWEWVIRSWRWHCLPTRGCSQMLCGLEKGKPHHFPKTWAHLEASAHENKLQLCSAQFHTLNICTFSSLKYVKQNSSSYLSWTFIYCSYLGKVFPGWKVLSVISPNDIIKVLKMLRIKPAVLFRFMATPCSLCLGWGGFGNCCLIFVKLVGKRMEMDEVAGAHSADTEGTGGTRWKSEVPKLCKCSRKELWQK